MLQADSRDFTNPACWLQQNRTNTERVEKLQVMHGWVILLFLCGCNHRLNIRLPLPICAARPKNNNKREHMDEQRDRYNQTRMSAR
mmetsp:Transcript_9323/g.25314  ORF Transcript_9323/g.25314 Transcript_9323/m.25314 type:complete len:86 (-) Transcript_9323:246-503(-)